MTIMFSPFRVPLWSRSRSCRPPFLSPNLYRRQIRWLRRVEPHNTASWSKTSLWIFYPTCAVVFGATCFVAYQTSQPFRHSVLAIVRCSRVAGKSNISFIMKSLGLIRLFMQVLPYLARLTTK